MDTGLEFFNFVVAGPIGGFFHNLRLGPENRTKEFDKDSACINQVAIQKTGTGY